MGVLKGFYNMITKILGWLVLPVFKFLRMILWDKTLRKFFNDVLKVTFIVGLIDDFLDVTEKLIKDPAGLFIMTNKSAWIIFAPWIVNLILFPIRKAQLMKSQYDETIEEEPIEQIEEVEMLDTSIEGEEPIQEGGALSIITSVPDMKTYIGVFIIVCIIYFMEKREICNSNKDEENKEKWNSWNLTKYSFWFGVFITAFYSANFFIFPYIPIIGIFFRISTSIPLIGKLVPGILTYFAYNILRNITEVMKTRTHCTLQ